MSVLTDDLHQRITKLCQEGDDCVNSDDYQAGLKKYHLAWSLLPEPKEDWEAATWVLSAIGDAHVFSTDFKSAVSAFTNALRCPDGLGNAFVHLRLGECYFELGDSRKAYDEFTRAYMGGGEEIFEDEDPKYLECVKSVLKPPVAPENSK